MKIGDKTPWPKGVPLNREAIRSAIARRGSIAQAAKRSDNNQRVNKAKKIVRELDEKAARADDPIEAAKAFLRRRGYRVFDRAVVLGKPLKGIQVGRLVLADDAAVIAYAAELGWKR